VELHWQDRAFSELSAAQLYAIVALRERVFVVEQACAYLDADGLDLVSRHLWAGAADPAAVTQPGAIHAYLRIVPAGAKFDEVSLGRIVTAPEARGTGLGRTLVRRGLDAVGDAAVRIGAQAHLERFYGELGFIRVSEPYLEDGIPHIDMLRGSRQGAA
jgi:ElaA protein